MAKRCPKHGGWYPDDMEMCEMCKNIKLVPQGAYEGMKSYYDKLQEQENETIRRQNEQERLQQQRVQKEVEKGYVPKCPVCQSTNIHKISATNKVGSVALFGVFSIGHVGKTFKCDSCGYKF